MEAETRQIRGCSDCRQANSPRAPSAPAYLSPMSSARTDIDISDSLGGHTQFGEQSAQRWLGSVALRTRNAESTPTTSVSRGHRCPDSGGHDHRWPSAVQGDSVPSRQDGGEAGDHFRTTATDQGAAHPVFERGRLGRTGGGSAEAARTGPCGLGFARVRSGSGGPGTPAAVNQRPVVAMDGVMNDRTINVEQQPRPMVVPTCPDNPQIADGHGRHGEANTSPVGHDLAAPPID